MVGTPSMRPVIAVWETMLPRSTTSPEALSISGSQPGSVSRATRIRPAQSSGLTSGLSTNFAWARAIPVLDGRPVSRVLQSPAAGACCGTAPKIGDLRSAVRRS